MLNQVWKWIGFLAIGLVIGFMGSFLFNNGSSKETAQQQETQAAPSNEEQSSKADSKGKSEETSTSEGTKTAASDSDNIFVQKGCVSCHSISPLDIKGNGTGPDFAIAYDDVQKRFGKTLEQFLEQPEGTMSAILSASPLTAEEKQEVIRLMKEYSGK